MKVRMCEGGQTPSIAATIVKEIRKDYPDRLPDGANGIKAKKDKDGRITLTDKDGEAILSGKLISEDEAAELVKKNVEADALERCENYFDEEYYPLEDFIADLDYFGENSLNTLFGDARKAFVKTFRNDTKDDCYEEIGKNEAETMYKEMLSCDSLDDFENIIYENEIDGVSPMLTDTVHFLVKKFPEDMKTMFAKVYSEEADVVDNWQYVEAYCDSQDNDYVTFEISGKHYAFIIYQ